MSSYDPQRTNAGLMGLAIGALISGATARPDNRVAHRDMTRLNDRQLDDLGFTRADVDTFAPAWRGRG